MLNFRSFCLDFIEMIQNYSTKRKTLIFSTILITKFVLFNKNRNILCFQFLGNHFKIDRNDLGMYRVQGNIREIF